MLDERTATATLDRLPPPGVLVAGRSGSFVGHPGRLVQLPPGPGWGRND